MLVCQQAARGRFQQEVPLLELEQRLGPLLKHPRQMWLAQQQGIITREELLNVVAAHLETFLEHRGGKWWAGPSPLVTGLTEFQRKLDAAFTAEDEP